MAALVNSFCQIVRVAADGIGFVANIHKVATTRNDDIRPVRIAGIVFDGIALVANVSAAGGKSLGSSHKTLANIKAAEVAAHCVNLPIKTVERTIDFAEGRIGKLQFLEGTVASFSSVARSGLEHSKEVNQHLLSLSPDDLSKVTEPIFDYSDPRHPREIGRKNITQQECKERLASAENALPVANAIEIAAKSRSAVTTTVKGMRAVYRTAFNQAVNGNPNANNGNGNAGNVQQNIPVAQVIDPLSVNLTDLTFIPEALHTDIVFRDYVCPITQEPIRDPVCDPNGTTLYERRAITTWINVNHRSPVTQQPLQVIDLLERPSLKIAIDTQLAFHQQRMRQALQQSMTVQLPNNLIQAARTENPNY